MLIFGTEQTSGCLDGHRERVYGVLATLLSHPDEGKWGRVLNADEQHRAIESADAVRLPLVSKPYTLLPGELGCEELDLRFLIVELCQPLEHLRSEYERVLCTKRPRKGCSPFAVDHIKTPARFDQAEFLENLAQLYSSFDFLNGTRLPRRPDHVACELEFMTWLIIQRRLASRMAGVDNVAAEQSDRCDLAQHNFFSDHLSGWVGSFAAGLQKHTGGGYFEPLGRFLAAWSSFERHHLAGEDRSGDILEPRRAVPAGT